MRHQLRLAAATLLATLALIAPAQLARAEEEPPMLHACGAMGVRHTVYSPTSVHIPTGIDWKSGPGGTVTVRIESGHKATTTVSISGSVDVATVVASARAQLGLSVAFTSSKSVSHAYTHSISPGKYGHLQFCNWGYNAKVKRWGVDARRNVTSTTYGTTKLVSTDSWGLRSWETSS